MFQIHDIKSSLNPTFIPRSPIYMPLIVVGGVSGVGKTSISWNLLQRQPDIHLLKTTTTRSPRRTAKEDIHYRFVTKKLFAVYQAAGRFVGSLRWPGNGYSYGLARAELAGGRDGGWGLYASTYFGGILKAQAPQKVLHIWLTCNDDAELQHRLQSRDGSGGSQLLQRWQTAVSEQQYVLEHQCQLLAQNQIDQIVDTTSLSVEAVAEQVEELIMQFLGKFTVEENAAVSWANGRFPLWF